MNFIKKPVSSGSRARRSPVYGVGINDADYMPHIILNGRVVICKIYTTWKEMLNRCYSETYQAKKPTYRGCTVCAEWLKFSNFRKWMVVQDWENMCLDKDILVQGNKIYSPETCIFVTKAINSLLITCSSSRGAYPVGVYMKGHRYQVRCCCDGERKHLGCFDDPDEAYEVYKAFKYKTISDIAEQQTEPLRSALLAYKINKY